MSSESNAVKSCAAIILAAGQSSRLGKPKQLLKYQGKTLLQHAIHTAKQSKVQSVIVVLGSNSDLVSNDIDSSGIHLVINNDWQSGIASAICCGIQSLRRLDSNVDAVILMVCDQPFVSPDILHSLVQKQKETGKLIIASQYDDTIGTPALFHKELFMELIALEGDSGAKKIMMQHSNLLATISFPKGSIDIDTIDDYKALGE